MEVILCKHSGFCCGVSKALKMLDDNVGEGSICTYGPIINNKTVTDDLLKKGVRIIEEIDEANSGETIVIRSHGVGPDVYRKIEDKNIKYIDCTCKDVKKIHEIVKKACIKGRKIIIIGNKEHPEVLGAKGYSGDDCIIIGKAEDIEKINFDRKLKYTVVVQTTYVQENFNKIISILNIMELDLEVCNTICPAMLKRQKEAEEISKIVDGMIVIGDKCSSNTNKLYEICKKNCKKTVLIETLEDLQLNIFESSVKIGIIAGASTPPDTIKEAFFTMSSLDNANNQSFEEMLNESFITLHTGDVVKGIVISVSNGEISVNLGYKSDGLIPRDEYSEDPNVDPSMYVKAGDEIEVFVIRVNDGDGNVLLSKKKIDAKRNFHELEIAFEEKTPLKGKIIEVVRGGVIALIKGVRVFVPSSQVSNRYVEDLNSLKGKEFNFTLLEFDKTKRRIVGGRKAFAAKEEADNKEKVFSSIQAGQQLEGIASRITNFGAFVDLGGVDGLIHISELSWGRVKKVSDVLSKGDLVKVTVLEVDKEKGRISLSLKDVKNDPWKNIEEKYKIGKIVGGKVVRMASFGAFVELEQGVDGLVHVSQISEKHVLKPEDELKIGQIIQVKVVEINSENNRISLSKKEADGVNSPVNEKMEENVTEDNGENIAQASVMESPEKSLGENPETNAYENQD